MDTLSKNSACNHLFSCYNGSRECLYTYVRISGSGDVARSAVTHYHERGMQVCVSINFFLFSCGKVIEASTRGFTVCGASSWNRCKIRITLTRNTCRLFQSEFFLPYSCNIFNHIFELLVIIHFLFSRQVYNASLS